MDTDKLNSYVERIRKAYSKQGAQILNIECVDDTTYMPIFKVEFTYKEHNCSITCPVETEDETLYHMQDIWNTDVSCEVVIDDRVWHGLDIPDYYGNNTVKALVSLDNILHEISTSKTYYERQKDQLFGHLKTLYNKIDALKLSEHEDFPKLVKFAQEVLKINQNISKETQKTNL